MKKICILGDSHSAGFRLAWNDLEHTQKNAQLTFFVDRGIWLTELEAGEQALVPSNDRIRQVIAHTSGGHETVHFPSYDLVLFVGLIWGYPRVDGYFSRASVRQALTDYLPTSVGFNILQKVRKVSDIPVFISHSPLLAYGGAVEEDGDLEPYRQAVRYWNDELLAEFNATMLEQPPETITHGAYTKLEYSVGSTRLDIGDELGGQIHPARDRTHMNKQFGVSCLSRYLPQLAA